MGGFLVVRVELLVLSVEHTGWFDYFLAHDPRRFQFVHETIKPGLPPQNLVYAAFNPVYPEFFPKILSLSNPSALSVISHALVGPFVFFFFI